MTRDDVFPKVKFHFMPLSGFSPFSVYLCLMKPELRALLDDAQKNRQSNQRLLKELKSKKPAQADKLFGEAHQEVFKAIDCLDCANCCKTTGPLFKQGDVERAARALKMKPSVFIETYLRTDEDGDLVLQVLPCPFLADDNYCMIYESRPYACRDYPHTDRKRVQQVFPLTEKNRIRISSGNY